MIAQASLGPTVSVVAALHSVAAARLRSREVLLGDDVLVFGNDEAARTTATALIGALGLRGWHAGPLDNAVAGESLTATLLFLNRYYGATKAGIKLVGLPEA